MCALIAGYISTHPGCSKDMIAAGTGLRIHQVNRRLVELKGIVQLVMVDTIGGRVGTYYVGKPKVRVVNAGDLIRKKYGAGSPDLRRIAHSGIRSSMGENGYD